LVGLGIRGVAMKEEVYDADSDRSPNVSPKRVKGDREVIRDMESQRGSSAWLAEVSSTLVEKTAYKTLAMGFIEEEEVVDHPAPSEPTPDMIADAIKSYSMGDPPTTNPASSTTTPQLPPSMDAYRNLSSAEILADLNKTPLFMTELEDNDELEAFKALAYEGTPSEVAQNFKEQGNDVFKIKSWADAKEFYSKAITVLQAEQRKRAEEKTLQEGLSQAGKSEAPTPRAEDEAEIKEQLKLLEACLGNRSACHVHLKNYRSATLDCAQVIRLNPSNIKAFYRSGVALLALSKIREANDACAHGLSLDPEHKDLKLLAQQIIEKAEIVDAKRRKEQAAELRVKQEAYVLKAALKARGIRMRSTAQPPDMEDAKVRLVPTAQPPDMEDAKVRLVPDPVDPTSSLVFPTVLLYPLVLQSDFIKEFGETETVGERLGYILAEPAPWDSQREYNPKGVECYVETMTGGLIKVGPKVTLLKLLTSGSVEVVDEVVRIFVVPKQKAEAWVADFKMKKAAEKKT
ncbi:hypothetical protein V491_05663, partial [Pseudogymnoascus sp. VKM F-3775]